MWRWYLYMKKVCCLSFFLCRYFLSICLFKNSKCLFLYEKHTVVKFSRIISHKQRYGPNLHFLCRVAVESVCLFVQLFLRWFESFSRYVSLNSKSPMNQAWCWYCLQNKLNKVSLAWTLRTQFVENWQSQEGLCGGACHHDLDLCVCAWLNDSRKNDLLYKKSVHQTWKPCNEPACLSLLIK